MQFTSLVVVCLCLLANVALGFYLPGLAPVNYCKTSESSDGCKVRYKFHRN